MTIIIGITNGKNITMGADSCISTENCTWELQQPKIIKKDEVLIGVAGGLRGLQILNYQLLLETQEELLKVEGWEDITDEVYICNYLVQCIKEIFAMNQYCVQVDAQEGMNDNFLIGYRGKLYHLGINYEIFSTTDDFMCIGSGSEYALGALKMQEKSMILLREPEESIRRTIEITSKYCPSVGGEVKIFNV